MNIKQINSIAKVLELYSNIKEVQTSPNGNFDIILNNNIKNKMVIKTFVNNVFKKFTGKTVKLGTFNKITNSWSFQTNINANDFNKNFNKLLKDIELIKLNKNTEYLTGKEKNKEFIQKIINIIANKNNINNIPEKLEDIFPFYKVFLVENDNNQLKKGKKEVLLVNLNGMSMKQYQNLIKNYEQKGIIIDDITQKILSNENEPIQKEIFELN